MKKIIIYTFFLLLVGLLFSYQSFAQYKAGDRIVISEPVDDDVYIAGGDIVVNSKIDGDLIVAGGKIVLRDTVMEDLMIGGGEIQIKGFVEDDIRAAGGEIMISGNIGDDVIVFGGEIYLTEDVIIAGDLVLFAGEVTVDGIIKGDIKVKGGDVNLKGQVYGAAEISGGNVNIDGVLGGRTTLVGGDIQLGEEARFLDDLTYWRTAGEMADIADKTDGTVTFDPDLSDQLSDVNWERVGILMVLFFVLMVVSSLLIITLVSLIFAEGMTHAGRMLDKNILKSLAYGVLYIIGVPLVAVFLMSIIIGLPIGIFVGGFYLFSIFFGREVASVALIYAIKHRYKKDWSRGTATLLSLALFVVLSILLFIPVLGVIINAICVCVAYGAIILHIMDRRKVKS